MKEKGMVKIRVYVEIREDLVKWVDKQVEKVRFGSRRHAFEYAIKQLMEKENRES